jgi:hypothetical protein
MTKVEFLREEVADTMMYEHNFNAGALLNSLIAAVREEERERITAILDDIEQHGVVPFLPSVRQRLSLPIYDWRAQTSELDPKEREP